ncbi:MAG: RNA polymerase sigma factor [Myxococcaceae bacterium]|nr:RNA polymerase sigma factor [Myxococcaceae bacterium]
MFRQPNPWAVSDLTQEEGRVRRAQAGDAQAFRALFDGSVGAVRRFLSDLLRDREAADEATQETFVRAHRQLGTLKEKMRFKAWVLGIARNVAFESRRGRSLHVALDETDSGDETLKAVIPSPDPEQLLLDSETEAAFDGALKMLSPNRRAALLFRLDHGLSYEEIAHALGWTLPMVKNEIHRARLLLRAQLLPHLRGSRP